MATINAINSTINSTTAGVVNSSNTGLLSSSATTNHAVQVGNASGQLTSLAVGATNQVLLGNTGADPSWGTVPNAALASSSITVTAGTGISVSGSPVSLGGTVTLSSVGGGVTWSVITSTPTTAVVNNGYFVNNAGQLSLALPATSAVGDVIKVVNINNSTGTKFTQATGQTISIGTSTTTSGASGSLTSSAVGNTITLVCRTANTTWWAHTFNGTWTVV